MKLAFIVQRYGREILGGSETLARQLAERLSRRHEITVLTTTAQDYITWANEYDPGEEKLRGVKVLRFPVVGERNLEEFNKFSEQIYHGQPTREHELEWLERQGPIVPELMEYLRKEHHRFDLLVFFTYLYYPTYYGLSVAPEKSILVPTAHDEPPLKLGIFKEMFQLPSSFVFNTEAEEILVLERFPVHKKMRETIGIGMELLDQPDPSTFRKEHDIPGKYLLYAGRIVAGKGLEELFRYFQFYKEEYPASGNFQLILIGKLEMKLPESDTIRYIGFVDEADKLSAMAGAMAVVQPSRMESLSIVTLEAFSVGTPVIATAQSPVLVDHCKKANAGLFYGDFEEFEEILNLLFSERNLARSLGRNGQRYIKENFGWSKLLSKYELVFRASARPAREPKAARAKAAPATREQEPKGREERPAAVEPTESAEGKPDQETKEQSAPEAEATPSPGAPRREAVAESASAKPERRTTEEALVETPPEEAPVETPKDRPSAEPDAHKPQRTRTEPRPTPTEETPAATVEVDTDTGRDVDRDTTDPDLGAPDEAQEPVDEKLAHLPSFYRSAVPPKPLAPRPAPAPDLPNPAVAEDEVRAPEEPAEEPSEESVPSDEEPLEEGELPAFYRPRPKGEGD